MFTSCVVLVSMVFDYSSLLLHKFIFSVDPVVVLVQTHTLFSLLDPNVTIWLAFDFKTFAVHLKLYIRYMARYMAQVPASLALKNNATKVM